MQMMMVQQLDYTQSHLLQWMGLFVSQGTIEKPVLAHYPASPSKLQTYRCCLQDTAGAAHSTSTAQFLSITTALPSCAGLTPGQDLFCVPAFDTPQGEVLHTKCLQELSRTQCLTQSPETGWQWGWPRRGFPSPLHQPTCPFLQMQRSRLVHKEIWSQILNSHYSSDCVIFHMIFCGKKPTADHILGQALCWKF